MSITVGDLLVKLGLDNSSLISGLNDSQQVIEKQSKSWQDQLKGIAIQQAAMGAAIMASMGKIVQSYVSAGSELYDLSLKTGVSAKALALRRSCENTGWPLSLFRSWCWPYLPSGNSQPDSSLPMKKMDRPLSIRARIPPPG